MEVLQFAVTDGAVNGIIDGFLQQGVLGLVILVEGYVIVKLYNKTESLQKEKDELMEARRLDAKETTEKVTNVLPGISQSLQFIYDKLRVSKHEGGE